MQSHKTKMEELQLFTTHFFVKIKLNVTGAGVDDARLNLVEDVRGLQWMIGKELQVGNLDQRR